MNSQLIHWVPRWFSRNFDVSGPDFAASGEFRFSKNQGSFNLGGAEYEISPNAPIGFGWSLTGPTGTISSATRKGLFSREFAIETNHGSATLKAVWLGSSSMTLQGAGAHCMLKPSLFTRSITMRGKVPDPPVACFALWIAGWTTAHTRAGV